MSLYEQWKELAEKDRDPNEHQQYWTAYFEKEKNNYAEILEKKESVITGKLDELAARFNMDTVVFMGFLDGINTSLNEPLKVEELDEESEIKLDIDFKKLFYNMLNAKADWLYNLSEWDNILTEDERKEIRKAYNTDHMAVSNKVGRNDQCPCGSGLKYKKCCGK